MSPAKHDGSAAPYSVIYFKGAAEPSRVYHDDPIVALFAAVEYLKAGYQVRLSAGCVEWFSHQPPASALDGAARVGAAPDVRFQAPEVC